MKDLTISRAMAIATLKLDREVARAEIADILGVTRQTAIKQKDKALSQEQIEKIEKGLRISLTTNIATDTYIDNSSRYTGKVEIKYWGKGLFCEEKIKNPLVTSLFFDKEVVNDGWQKDEKNLNIIAMPGDKMDGGETPYRNGDILVIDTSSTDISLSGIYFYTTNNNEEVFVNNFRKTPFGRIVIGFSNTKYEDYEVPVDEFEAAGINIVGRIIHNMFYTS